MTLESSHTNPEAVEPFNEASEGHKVRFLRWAKHRLFDEISSPKNDTLPEDEWPRIPIHINDDIGTLETIYKPAEDPIALIAFCTGFKASTATYKETIEGLNKRGISVLTINLPLPEELEKQDFYKEYLDIVKQFYTNPESPIFKLAEEANLPLFSLTHSTGGLLFTDLVLNDEEMLTTLSERYIGHTHISPFFSAANAARGFHPFKHKLFSWHRSNNAERRYGETLLDLPFTVIQRLNGNTEISEEEATPTYGQISKLIENGERISDQLNGGIRFTLIPQCFIMSPKDPNSSYQAAQYVATKLPAVVRRPDGFHNPLEGNGDLLNEITDAMKKEADTYRTVVANQKQRPLQLQKRLKDFLQLFNWGDTKKAPTTDTADTSTQDAATINVHVPK